MKIDQLLSRLNKVSKRGDYWMAKCPSHNDNGPSLSIKESGGRILLNCFAGCSTERVTTALGISMSELFSGDTKVIPIVEPAPLSENRFHEAYDCFLSCLEILDFRQMEEIEKRKLNVRSYFCLTQENFQKAKEKVKRCCDNWREVPGMLLEKCYPGVVIPVRTMEGKIRALLVRTDCGKPKYVYLSGSGVSVGPTLHWRLASTDRTLRITEGPLKADSIYHNTGVSIVALPGVGQWVLAVEAAKRYNAKDLLLAFDSDWRTNDSVRKSLLQLGKALDEDGYNVLVETWDERYKGLDDLLLAGHQPVPIEWKKFVEGVKPLSKDATGRTDVVVCTKDVVIRGVDWLWDKWLPLGEVTIMDGDPGLGKSQITCSLAASVTTGLTWPSSTGENGPSKTPVSGVVFLTAEDTPETTVVPRLMASGADLSKCFIHKYVRDKKETRLLSFPRDINRLEDIVRDHDAKLLVIDPLFSYVGNEVDSWKDASIRTVMSQLSRVAEKTRCAVLVLRHLNKGSGTNAVYRGGGSIGIIASCRMGWIVGRDPQEPECFVLAPTKCNLGKMPTSLSYAIEERIVGEGVTTSQIVWLGSSELRSGDLVGSPKSETTQSDRMLEWLADLVSGRGGLLDRNSLADECKKKGYNYAKFGRMDLGKLSAYDITRDSVGDYRLLGGIAEIGNGPPTNGAMF